MPFGFASHGCLLCLGLLVSQACGAGNLQLEKTEVSISFQDPVNLNGRAPEAPDNGEDFSPRILTDALGAGFVFWESTDPLSDEIGEDQDVLLIGFEAGTSPSPPPSPLSDRMKVDASRDTAPDMAASGSGLWICVWASEDSLGGTLGEDSDILISRRTSPDGDWSPPEALCSRFRNDSGQDSDPRIETDGNGNWVVVWISDDDLGMNLGSDFDVLVSTSEDDGVTWSDPQPVSAAAAEDDAFEYASHLATDGDGNWLCVWSRSEPQIGTSKRDLDVLVARSSDSGDSWSEPAFLNPLAANDDGDDWRPQVVSDRNGNWMVAWYSIDCTLSGGNPDFDIVVTASSDNGATWNPPNRANNLGADDRADDAHPSLGTDGRGRWFLAWHSKNMLEGQPALDWDIHFAMSEDLGDTWTDEANVNSDWQTDTADDTDPDLAVDHQGRPHVVWQRNGSSAAGAHQDVLYSRGVLPMLSADLDGNGVFDALDAFLFSTRWTTP
jgi:hypothetical protein